MKHTETAGEYHADKDGNIWHFLKIIDTLLHCTGRHFQHDLRTVIEVSDSINYRIQCYECESSSLYSDDIRSDVFYAIQPYSVVGDVSTFRV